MIDFLTWVIGTTIISIVLLIAMHFIPGADTVAILPTVAVVAMLEALIVLDRRSDRMIVLQAQKEEQERLEDKWL